ncbi:hypothetical protein Pse7367_1045 [Thalassoporum mexicanum PCC 7367]|uniref:ferritin-like domain-containing protein n=1 Tax=Thalassoporum mexicanum TaxID=3457544 RepID=UPI00029FB732|nr:ferritin-like domain-containing protein [Pseudanabaena sp. PCC 7367]AFY69343.1 hypothetical protein Pse7367_1045 [Pseudanabaena sp. PCC 7367]
MPSQIHRSGQNSATIANPEGTICDSQPAVPLKNQLPIKTGSEQPEPVDSPLLKIHSLLNNFLSFRQLSDRLEDLPAQFQQPQMRPWQLINWQAIDPSLIIGITPQVYLAVLQGCMNIEAPIHSYSHTSWQYLQQLYPEMARFVGGMRSADGTLVEMGLWEKEERQHAPVLRRLYKQLAGQPPQSIKLRAKEYKPSGDRHQDLFRHGLHRTTTEYGATCLYLWLMAHSTGALRDLMVELFRDEVNHMTKFLGFGLWAFPGSRVALTPIFGRLFTIGLAQIKRSWWVNLRTSESEPKPIAPSQEILRSTDSDQQCDRNSTRTFRPPTNNLFDTFTHVMGLVGWRSWSWPNRLELIWVFVIVLWRLRCWSRSLSDIYLQDLFGIPPLANQSQQAN